MWSFGVLLDCQTVGPRVASVVSLNAARCLIERPSDFPALKSGQAVRQTVGLFLDAEVVAAWWAIAPRMRRGWPPKTAPNDCLQKRHSPRSRGWLHPRG